MEALNYYLPDVVDAYEGKLRFNGNTPIFKSLYSDICWSWFEKTSQHSTGEVSDTINWSRLMGNHLSTSNTGQSKYDYCLTPKMVDDLKVAAGVQHFFPFILKHNKNKKTIKPATIKGRIEPLAAFLSLIITEEKKKGVPIDKINDITFSDLKKYIPMHNGRGSALKRSLKLIADPTVQRNLVHGELEWNLKDIESKKLRWNEDTDHVGYAPLSDDLFLFLNEYCINKIGHFKRSTGMVSYDASSKSVTKITKNLKEAINNWYTHDCGYRELKVKYGLSRSDVSDIINEASITSMIIIFLYTGMRDSEIKNIKSNCLELKDGYWFIRSGVKKHRPDDLPFNRDAWLAIDIVRDAVEILQYICKYTNNTFLFSSKHLGTKEKPNNLPLKAIRTKHNRYFEKLFKSTEFEGASIHPHQYRETLVNQLAKAEVGVTYITMQLKHLHSKFSIVPNEVTAGYGQYKKELMESITKSIPKAREQSLIEVYGEGKKFAGGAAEKHVARVEEFFTGMSLFGEDREKYIRHLAKTNTSTIPTSIGGCTRNHNEKCIKEEEKPRCYGDYMCDPECSNHLIPESSGPLLRQREEHARTQSEKPEQSHYKKIWIELADTLNKQIKKLEI